MKLREWLFYQKMSNVGFARLIKKNRVVVYKWRKGIHRPDEKMMRKITEYTLGRVKRYEDLLDE
jgi:hypothetical protein